MAWTSARTPAIPVSSAGDAELWPRLLTIGSWFAPRRLAAALLLLGAAARCRQYLAGTSYWYDEASLLLNIFQKSFVELAGPLNHEQAAPPLFLWIERACFIAGGPSEIVMRLPALLASLAGLVLMVPLARAIVGAPGWIWAVGCCSVSSSALHLTYQVKPYTIDFVATEVVLLLAIGCLAPAAAIPARRPSAAGLVLAAIVAPWLSFPSAFVLAAACLALLVRAIRARQFRWWALWFVHAVALFSSCAALWYFAARHHNTSYQQGYWAAEFMDLSSVIAAAAWCGHKLIEAGNDGVQGTGLPIALLAVIGLVGCWRREPTLAILLVAPAGLACVAAALRDYPLANRLLFFLLPCLWSCAAQGLTMASGRIRGRAKWIAAAAGVIVLLAGGVRTARYAVFAKPSVEFREAFDYVHRHLCEGDALWVSHPGVYEVYFGRPAYVLDDASPEGVVEQAARQGRVWMICHPPRSQTTLWNDALNRIQSVGAAEVARRGFVHLDISLFLPQAPAPLTADSARQLEIILE